MRVVPTSFPILQSQGATFSAALTHNLPSRINIRAMKVRTSLDHRFAFSPFISSPSP
jgi:hypothetical protein